MSAGIKANNDGSAAIQVGGTDYIQIASTGPVTIPGNLIVTGSATIGGQPAGGNYALNAYTSPATWTKPAGLKAIKVTVVGAGGAGGPSNGTNTVGGGGGAGGSALDYIPAPSIPGPQSITAGPGTNSFGAFCSATAGSAGTPNIARVAAGGAGGTGSGGQANISGGYGDNGVAVPIPASPAPQGAGSGGAGGASVFGGGGRGGLATNVPAPAGDAGDAGLAYGSGGGGSIGPAVSGGAGAPGIVIVEEFY